MMDRTDRHYRYFARLLSRRTLLYTEMITTNAILRGDTARLLGFSPEEKPLSLQLGGDKPADLAACARIAEEHGYDEVNLNAGCPSDRVQSGRFGACLMDEPDRVADMVADMRAATALPVTVKHRIGVDDRASYENLCAFVSKVAAAGCDRFTVHARAAWLQGLSPKENREIPPLRYEEVHRLKREFPHLSIEINGGITSLDQASQHLSQLDAVMIGRAAYDEPYLLASADARLFAEARPAPTRREVVEELVPYAERWRQTGRRVHDLSRHILGLFAHQPGGRAWRRTISQEAARPDAGSEILLRALSAAEQEAARLALRSPS
jgi:tRNA-dihydrouridine synthase A